MFAHIICFFLGHKYLTTLQSNKNGTRSPADQVLMYCSRCGKTRFIQLPCSHEWVDINTVQRTNTLNNSLVAKFIEQKCKTCGELRMVTHKYDC